MAGQISPKGGVCMWEGWSCANNFCFDYIFPPIICPLSTVLSVYVSTSAESRNKEKKSLQRWAQKKSYKVQSLADGLLLYLVLRFQFSRWARCLEGSWRSSLRFPSGWHWCLLLSASATRQQSETVWLKMSRYKRTNVPLFILEINFHLATLNLHMH